MSVAENDDWLRGSLSNLTDGALISVVLTGIEELSGRVGVSEHEVIERLFKSWSLIAPRVPSTD